MTGWIRKLWLALGSFGVVGGLLFGVLWMQAPHSAAQARPPVVQPAVLVAARPITAGALLRESDFDWRPLGGAAAPAGAFLKGAVAKAAVAGSAARRGFSPGEVLVGDGLVRPDQRDFLAAVLAPGERAVTIPVDAPQSASGLLLPGDHVDVILVQEVGEAERRMAAETVLHNSRVLAVGHNFSSAKSTGLASDAAALLAPKTVTLEVTPHDAERLYVAAKLGDLQLSLRPVGDMEAGEAAPPVWAGEVSDATKLRRSATAAATLAAQLGSSQLGGSPPGVAPHPSQPLDGAEPPLRRAAGVVVLRGGGHNGDPS